MAEVLGVAGKLRALDAIAAGDVDPAHFDVVDDDWDLRERSAAALARLGLNDVAPERRLATFSGGEAMSLGLVAQLLRRPDVLLLDEPTNNLDQATRQRLYGALQEWKGCLLVASHDRELLDRMEQIAELTPSGLRLYGGGYAFYRETQEAERRAAEQQARNLRSELKREKRDMQQARERTARRAGNAARNVADAGLPRIVAGNRKSAAQTTAAKADATHAARVQQVRSRLHDATQALGENAVLDLSLPATRVPADRVLFSAEGLRVRRGGRDLFGAHGLAFTIRGPQRIALRGVNGAGKSTLLRVIAGECTSDGSVRRGAGRVLIFRSGWTCSIPRARWRRTLHLPRPTCRRRSAQTCSPGCSSRAIAWICLRWRCLAASAFARCWPAYCMPRRRQCFCCWMNRPTTSTSMRWTC